MLSSTSDKYAELRKKYTEKETEAITLQHLNDRLKIEKENLANDNLLLREECEMKAADITAMKKSHLAEVSDVKDKLINLEMEQKQGEKMIARLKTLLNTSNEAVERLQGELKKIRDKMTQMEETHSHELRSKEKFIEMHKSRAEEASTTITEMQSGLEVLRKTIQQNQEDYEDTLRDQKQIFLSLQKEYEACVEEMNKMKEESEGMPREVKLWSDEELVEKIEQVLGEGGSSYPQYVKMVVEIDQRYQKAMIELQKTKTENRKLSTYMKEIEKQLFATVIPLFFFPSSEFVFFKRVP